MCIFSERPGDRVKCCHCGYTYKKSVQDPFCPNIGCKDQVGVLCIHAKILMWVLSLIGIYVRPTTSRRWLSEWEVYWTLQPWLLLLAALVIGRLYQERKQKLWHVPLEIGHGREPAPIRLKALRQIVWSELLWMATFCIPLFTFPARHRRCLKK